MKTFELSSKKNKNGKRHFKLILHKIQDDSCVDAVTQTGTEYNKNGITWLSKYCEQALPTIKGMSLRAEFLDDERTSLCGHGETGVCDGEPTFEDAVVIGTFTNGYIEEVETENGIITACVGEGEIDSQCYHNLTVKLEEDALCGIYPSCSVEIMRADDNDEIIYEYGYKEKGRIPMVFRYSGCALLGCTPADDNAKLLELNSKNKEENNKMTAEEMKELISQTVNEVLACKSEIEKCKEESEKKVEEANAELENTVSEKNEIVASSEKIQEALTKLQADYNTLWAEREALEKALGEAKARERIGEMNSAIAEFTDEEKAYAKAEMEAFEADPVTCEINSVVNKIWEGIGKNAKAVAEQNSMNAEVEDIFSEVVDTTPAEDISIF